MSDKERRGKDDLARRAEVLPPERSGRESKLALPGDAPELVFSRFPGINRLRLAAMKVYTQKIAEQNKFLELSYEREIHLRRLARGPEAIERRLDIEELAVRAQEAELKERIAASAARTYATLDSMSETAKGSGKSKAEKLRDQLKAKAELRRAAVEEINELERGLRAAGDLSAEDVDRLVQDARDDLHRVLDEL